MTNIVNIIMSCFVLSLEWHQKRIPNISITTEMPIMLIFAKT